MSLAPWQGRDRLDLLPLRQMVTAQADAARAFARQDLLDWLGRPERFRIVSHPGGGQILATGERALEDARAVLRQAYGAALRFGIPTVHSFVDRATGSLMVPVIFVRVDAARGHAPQLQRILAARSADVREVELQKDRAVIRAEIALARSLGLEQEVMQATLGAAHILSWLLRYERADGQGPQGTMGSRPGMSLGHN